ncbi:alpha/beta fold hydrolase [Acidiphilium sp.]|uniref:alpha/beta fold hydrolase n=2 Tax=Acidiphilium TaxID=522 RepID=UPI00338F4F0D
MPFLPLDARLMRLQATITGTGPDVVLLHGLFGSGRNLGVIARGLAGRFRVIALDARNHGASGHAADMRYATMAADVAETMAALGVGRARVVGHSMGGKIAMMLALVDPALVERLAVLDIAPVAYGHEHDLFVASMRGLALSPDLTRQQADAALAGAIPDPALRGFLLHNLVLGAAPRWRLGLDEIAGAMGDLVSWPEGLSGSYPGGVLFLRGALSSYVPESAYGAIRRYFPAAVIETIEETGHWLHAEKPQAVVAALEGFLG